MTDNHRTITITSSEPHGTETRTFEFAPGATLTINGAVSYNSTGGSCGTYAPTVPLDGLVSIDVTREPV